MNKDINTFAVTSKDARWNMGLETGNISQMDFMICNSLKMKTYHILCKVFKTCVGLGRAKKNNKQREKEREKRKEERKAGKSQKEKWQKKTG